MISNNIPTIYWHEVAGNTLSRNIEYRMISENVELILPIRRKSDSRRIPPSTYRIIYDQSYVLNYISKKVIQPLLPLDIEEVLNIVEKANLLSLKNAN